MGILGVYLIIGLQWRSNVHVLGLASFKQWGIHLFTRTLRTNQSVI